MPEGRTREAVEPRWTFVQDVLLPLYEDTEPGDPRGDALFAPPGKVLSVKVVAERVFLAFCKYEEGHDMTKTTHMQAESCSAEALLNALVMQMGVEYVQGLLRRQEGGA